MIESEKMSPLKVTATGRPAVLAQDATVRLWRQEKGDVSFEKE